MKTTISYAHIFYRIEETITYPELIHYSEEHIDALKQAKNAIRSLELLNLSKIEFSTK